MDKYTDLPSVSILGCGWLGLPLGAYLANKGIRVKGSVTSASRFAALQQAGILPFVLKLSPEISGSDPASFFASEVLVVNFPPERRQDIVAYHTAQISALLESIRKSLVQKVLFVSSTSVYPDTNGVVDETCALPAEKDSGKALKVAENMLFAEKELAVSVVRFGGLIGYDRLPGRFLASRKDVVNAEAPVNLIHRDDCVLILERLISRGIWGEVFNACADRHPMKKDYYIEAAKKAGLEPPQFFAGHTSFKIVSSDKLKSRLGYQFKYPDPAHIHESNENIYT